MALPLHLPFSPMEALSVDEIPTGTQWRYEPKWDGFRCLASRDGEEIQLQSKSGRPMTRYFPELIAALAALKPEKFMLDGEIVVPAGDDFSFDALLQRIHPAASRIRKLSAETPALLIAFDLLVGADGRLLTDEPLDARRELLEAFYRKYCRCLGNRCGCRLRAPSSAKPKRGCGAAARRSTASSPSGAILPIDRATAPACRRSRTIAAPTVWSAASAITKARPSSAHSCLGLYDKRGLLDHVGFTSTIKRQDKPALTKKLKPLIGAPGFTGKAPGGPSRWSTKRSGEWVPLKPKLVVEVCYDHFSGDRFRHGTRLVALAPG